MKKTLLRVVTVKAGKLFLRTIDRADIAYYTTRLGPPELLDQVDGVYTCCWKR